MKNDKTLLIGGSLKGLALPQKSGILTPTSGQLSVDGTKLYRYTGTVWNQEVDLLESLFTFSTFTFTNRGQNLPTGSSLAEFKTAYGSQPWIDTYFNVTGGIQHFTVPKSGKYTFIVCGAAGSLGSPAKIVFTRDLQKGDVMHMICGQPGFSLSDGSGASVVYTDSLGLLAVAGGAGGYQGAGGTASQRNAKIDLANPGTGLGGNGSSRTSGANSVFGCGGAGWMQDGFRPTGGANSQVPSALNKAAPNGGYGTGVGGTFTLSFGGFGGGGGSAWSSALGIVLGGGGGYNGGAAIGVINLTASASGVGGTSYLGAGNTLQSITLESATANFGKITVTLNP